MADNIMIHCAYTDLVDITSVVPNPRNPNHHSDKQVELLAKVIKAQGWRAPITVSNRSGFIVRGHGRLMAAQLLGLDTVPIDRQDYESEAAEYADLIALCAQGIKNSSKLGELVFEPFGGSGSTLIACEQTKRRCRCIELDPKYCDVIVKRYIEFIGSNKNVYVIRNGQRLEFSEVAQ